MFVLRSASECSRYIQVRWVRDNQRYPRKEIQSSREYLKLISPSLYSICSSNQEGTLPSPLGNPFSTHSSRPQWSPTFPTKSPLTPPTRTESPFSELVATVPVLFTSWYNSVPIQCGLMVNFSFGIGQPAFESNSVFSLTFLNYILWSCYKDTMKTHMQSAQHE